VQLAVVVPVVELVDVLVAVPILVFVVVSVTM
jgi:hypothetical protein